MPEATNEVVVDHPRRLHECEAGHRPAETESKRLELPRHRSTFFRLSRDGTGSLLLVHNRLVADMLAKQT